MQRAALTGTRGICLRCSILSWRIGASLASRHIGGYEVPSWISNRTITTGNRSSQASSPLPTSTEITPAAFTGVKRSENWEEGWFEGNIHQKAFGGIGASVRRGPYRGVAVKRVREVRMSRADGIGNGSWGGRNEVESVAVVAEGGGTGKAVAKRQEPSSEESSSSPYPTAAEETPPEEDLPETTIRKPLNQNQREPPDERTVNLGKTVRTLQRLLPTMLSSPTSIPNSVLSPSVTLHLFPSSHPHLPTARGRVAYKTALWTSPFVWGQLPGRAKLEILAARVVKPCDRGEELRVRWRAVPSSSSTPSTKVPDPPTHPNLFKSDSNGNGDTEKGFSGLFIFTFDDKGRILSHTIEHADRGWNRGEEESGYSFLGWKKGGRRWKWCREVIGQL
ncbi:hypothetical protein BGX38DRAFT_821337 [Terfezia claveryi]|nr:hypothetical protein BGX38DRAFT_821337 [Terfezia claveryi]